jgi:hypothetical protein
MNYELSESGFTGFKDLHDYGVSQLRASIPTLLSAEFRNLAQASRRAKMPLRNLRKYPDGF